MKILALETATEVCSVALSLDGQCVERNLPDRRHAERVIELVDGLLAEAGIPLAALDAVAFGRGPGMFTGLRIGAGVAQGLAFAAGLPVVPVSTLEILAHGVETAGGAQIVAALDARMEQVYWGVFARDASGSLRIIGSERVDAPERVRIEAGPWVGVGSGWDRYGDAMRAASGGAVVDVRAGQYPQACVLAAIAATRLQQGGALAPEQALPVYVRDDVAHKAGGR